MKTQLPPELVEKMKHEIKSFNWKDITEGQAIDNCAQIAVEYAAENSFNSISSVAKLSLEKSDLKQQRDELLEALKTVQICSNYKEVKAKHGNCDNWVNIIDELINRIDGKK